MGESLANFSMSNVLQNLSQQIVSKAYTCSMHRHITQVFIYLEKEMKLDIVGGIAIALYPSLIHWFFFQCSYF